ncbi:hypothetical protein DET49_108151 [Salegentibacter sp. 24]|nr:hypothetical protein DET49_108151 [Salegentibacter sp. 24]
MGNVGITHFLDMTEYILITYLKAIKTDDFFIKIIH